MGKSATPKKKGVLKGGKTPASKPMEPTHCAACGRLTEVHGAAHCSTCTQSLATHKRSIGRPTLYDPETHPTRVRNLCMLGLTDAQIAGVLEIAESTLQVWKRAHPEFMASIKEGREDADGKVARSLYERAMGYTHDDEEIKVVDKTIERVAVVKHYPPDTQAISLWLRNRQPHLFRERTSTEITGLNDGPIQHEVGTPTDYAMLRAKIKAKQGENA